MSASKAFAKKKGFSSFAKEKGDIKK